MVPIVDDSTKKFSALIDPLSPPIRCSSAQTRMITEAMTTNAIIPLPGVRRVGWPLPSQRGSSPSRPALKISRACEFTAEMSTPRVEVSPAIQANSASQLATSWDALMNGMSALLSAVTLYKNAVAVAYAYRRYPTTMSAIDMYTARGTFRRGLAVSSARAAEFSQPMNREMGGGNPAARPL